MSYATHNEAADRFYGRLLGGLGAAMVFGLLLAAL